MNRDSSVVSLLKAMRSQIDVALSLLGDEEPSPEACPHPDSFREDIGSFGTAGKRWLCRACGYEFLEESE